MVRRPLPFWARWPRLCWPGNPPQHCKSSQLVQKFQSWSIFSLISMLRSNICQVVHPLPKRLGCYLFFWLEGQYRYGMPYFQNDRSQIRDIGGTLKLRRGIYQYPTVWLAFCSTRLVYLCNIIALFSISDKVERSQRSLKPMGYRDRLCPSKSGSLYLVSVRFGKFLSLLSSYQHRYLFIVVQYEYNVFMHRIMCFHSFHTISM